MLYTQNESSIHEIVKKEKEICAGFAVTPQTTKAMATVHGKCSVKLENALNLWMETMNRKGSSAIQSWGGGVQNLALEVKRAVLYF